MLVPVQRWGDPKIICSQRFRKGTAFFAMSSFVYVNVFSDCNTSFSPTSYIGSLINRNVKFNVLWGGRTKAPLCTWFPFPVSGKLESKSWKLNHLLTSTRQRYAESWAYKRPLFFSPERQVILNRCLYLVLLHWPRVSSIDGKFDFLRFGCSLSSLNWHSE